MRKQTHAQASAGRSAVETGGFAWLLRERAEVQSSVVPLAALLEEVNAGNNARQTFLERFFSTAAPECFLASVGPVNEHLKRELADKGLDESEVRKWLAKGLELRDELAALRREQRLMVRGIANAGAYRRALTTMRKRTQLTKVAPPARAALETLANVVGREVVDPRARAAAAFDGLLRAILRGVRPETFAARYAAEHLSAIFPKRPGRSKDVGLVAALLKAAGLINGGPTCWNSMTPPSCARMLPLERKKKRRRRERIRAARRCLEDRCALATEAVKKMLRRREGK